MCEKQFKAKQCLALHMNTHNEKLDQLDGNSTLLDEIILESNETEEETLTEHQLDGNSTLLHETKEVNVDEKSMAGDEESRTGETSDDTSIGNGRMRVDGDPEEGKEEESFVNNAGQGESAALSRLMALTAGLSSYSNFM